MKKIVQTAGRNTLGEFALDCLIQRNLGKKRHLLKWEHVL